MIRGLLRTGLVYESYVPTKEFREKRSLIRHRISLVRNRTMLENKVHSLLDKYDCKTDLTDIFGKSGTMWLKTLDVSHIDKVILNTTLAALENINLQINIISKELAGNLLLQTEKYLDGTSDALQLKAAMDRLQSNIITIKQGGLISGADLKPLASDFFDLWNNVNGNWNLYKTSVTQILPYQQVKATTSSVLKSTTKTINQLLLKKQFESMDLIASSDRLVNQLALQTDKNSNDLLLLQILFAVLIVSILILILYLVARMLKMFDLTQATSKIIKETLM